MEWLVYDRVLNVQERLEVEEYLRQRAGIAPYFAPGSLDLSTWQPVSYPGASGGAAGWAGNLAQREVTAPAASAPSLLLAPLTTSEQVIRASLGAGTTPGFMGFAFGYQDRGHFYLFDWNRQATNHPDDGSAAAGMRLREFHVPGGQDPDSQDFWSSPNPERVTTLLTNTVPWKPGVDDDLTLRLLPGRFELEVSEGGLSLVSWSVPLAGPVAGQFGFYLNDLANARLGQVVLPGEAPFITEVGRLGEGRGALTWVNGLPPFVLQYRTNLLSDEWLDLAPATMNLTHEIPLAEPVQFLRVQSSGFSP